MKDSEVYINIINFFSQPDTSLDSLSRICRVLLLGDVEALGQAAFPCGFLFLVRCLCGLLTDLLKQTSTSMK